MSRPAPAPARELLLAPIEPAGAVEQVVRPIGEASGAGLPAPGGGVPGQVELAETLGVARMTLRQALAVLEDAGLLEIRRGRTGGAFIAPDPPPPAPDPPTAAQLRALTPWRRAGGAGGAGWGGGRPRSPRPAARRATSSRCAPPPGRRRRRPATPARSAAPTRASTSSSPSSRAPPGSAAPSATC